jgi:hypothetical protein
VTVFPCRGKSVLPNKAYHASTLSVNPKPTLLPALAPRSPLTLRPLVRSLHKTNFVVLIARGFGRLSADPHKSVQDSYRPAFQ